MGLFDIDWVILNKLTLPNEKRKAVRLAILRAFTTVLESGYNDFMTNRYDNLYKLSHNSQVCYLQGVLNDAFDNALRRIVIIDNTNAGPVYIYEAAEAHPVYIYKVSESHPVYLYTDGEDSGGFVVEVPSSLSFDSVYMHALIDKFKLPSKIYFIKLV